jgi:hypothetical protein
MSKKPFDPEKILSNRQFTEIIRYCFAHGTVTPRDHVQQRMIERGFSIRDIEHILLSGIIEEAEYDPVYGCCKYRVRGNALDDKKAVVVTAIVNEDRLVLVTVFRGRHDK